MEEQINIESNSIQNSERTDGRESKMAKRIMAMTGYLLIVGGLILIGFLAYQYLRWPVAERPEDDQIIVWIIQQFADDILIFIGSVFFSLIGIRLLGAAGKGVQTIIPPNDRELLTPLIETANKEAIDLYVILSSLSGFTGTFQKIGFYGLPLATVTLTLIFSALSFVQSDFLELAKLTLGAFIGSFVQKGSDSIKLPSLKVS